MMILDGLIPGLPCDPFAVRELCDAVAVEAMFSET